MIPALVTDYYDDRTRLYEWVLTGSQSGVGVVVPHKADKTVQWFGDFGAGNIQIEGSLESDPVTATNYFVLRDASHALLSGKTSAFGEVVLTNTYLLRPVAASVNSVTVRLLMVG